MTLNIENFEIIRGAIATQPRLYNQSIVGKPECGIAGCLLGWRSMIFPGDSSKLGFWARCCIRNLRSVLAHSVCKVGRL